jgi:Tfp pilus assembly protein PilF
VEQGNGSALAGLRRLELGLAKIREGDLHEGRREIEVAASLDPNNSIVRSYLGKTYYEEKRIPLDEREYAIAKYSSTEEREQKNG